jgi:hypothetical protein
MGSKPISLDLRGIAYAILDDEWNDWEMKL